MLSDDVKAGSVVLGRPKMNEQELSCVYGRSVLPMLIVNRFPDDQGRPWAVAIPLVHAKPQDKRIQVPFEPVKGSTVQNQNLVAAVESHNIVPLFGNHSGLVPLVVDGKTTHTHAFVDDSMLLRDVFSKAAACRVPSDRTPIVGQAQMGAQQSVAVRLITNRGQQVIPPKKSSSTQQFRRFDSEIEDAELLTKDLPVVNKASSAYDVAKSDHAGMRSLADLSKQRVAMSAYGSAVAAQTPRSRSDGLDLSL